MPVTRLPRSEAPARTVHGNVLARLGEGIVGGRWPPGSTLPPEPQLGEELGVSRTVVREAVKSLAAKGLVVTGPKVGTRVLPENQWNWFDAEVVGWQVRAGVTRGFLRDLVELRRNVEPAAVRLAAERASDEDIAALEAAYEGMARAVDARDGAAYIVHDLAFHQGLLRASHNRMLGQMGQALGALLRASFEMSTRRPNGAAASLPLHRAVLDAVIAGNARKAEKASLTLIDGAGEDMKRVLASGRRLPVVLRQSA